MGKERREPSKTKAPGVQMASPARFERAAFRLGGERSILLSYGDIWSFESDPLA